MAYDFISAEPVTPKDFIDKLFSICPNGKRPLFCSFKQPASQGKWAASKISDITLQKLYKYKNLNRYITVSTFEGNRRRKSEFDSMVAIMVDDPGTKIKFENIVLPPTFWLETSPGNYQAWYFLAKPITDRPYAESIVNAMIAQGLSKDGKDPGMKGVTRYGRLPGGWNNKESLEKPHRVEAYEDTRGCNYYTAEDIIEAYDLDLEAVASAYNSSIDGAVDILDIGTAKGDPIYQMIDSLGLIKYEQGHKFEITCPWVDDHTGGVDNGTALLVQPGGSLGFKCHHGHDEHKTLEDVHDWLYENHFELYNEYYPEDEDEEFEEPELSIQDTVKRLLDRGVADSELAIAIPRIASEYKYSSYDVQQIVRTLKTEYDEDEKLTLIDLDQLATDAETNLVLRDAFPELLADAISTKCDSDRLDPIRPVQSLIPCIASQLGSRTCIVLKPAARHDEEWREYPLISCIDIGNPSEGKSQTNRTITAPLVAQQTERYNEYVKEKDLYNECCRMARRAGNELPEEPIKPPKLYVTGGTSEGIMKRISELPPRSGMLYICDELAGLLAGADQYKSGKGNFKNILLTAMTSPLSGTEERSNTENGEIIFRNHTLCISGSIQLSRIKHLFDPEYDESGLGSRFLCAYPDLPDDF